MHVNLHCLNIDCTLTFAVYNSGGPPRPGMLPTPPMGGPPMMPMMGPPPHGMMPGGPGKKPVLDKDSLISYLANATSKVNVFKIIQTLTLKN